MTYKTNKIVIVGGGSSGWIVASILCKYLLNSKITLIESPKIGTIGVGESTTAMMSQLINILGIDEKKFIKGTDGIYKLSVKFNDFYKLDDEGFHYPFGEMDIEGLNSWGAEAWHLVKNFYPKIKISDFSKSFYAYETLCEKNKIDENINGFFGSSIKFETDKGYHFNANLIGPWLKNNWCEPKGVEHVLGEVKNVVTNEDGIEFLVLEDGSKIFADLFIDCSGFKSILLGKAMKEKYISFSHKLPNNKAWAVPTEYKNKHIEMRPYTNATALKNGWAWHTPIWSRVGNGYAYSDKYVNSENALKEFKEYLMSNKVPMPLSKKEVENLPFFEINMKAGKYKNTFVKNVCAIGLSSGFLEPLEGTGLFFISEPAITLLKVLNRGAFTQYNIDLYNYQINKLYERWLNLLSLYYAYSLRDDSLYWKEISNKTFDEKILNPNEFNNEGYLKHAFNSMTDHSSSNLPEVLSHILRRGELDLVVGSSMGVIQDIYPYIIDRWNFWDKKNYYIDANIFKNFFENRKNKWEALANKSKNNYDYLKEKVYN